MGDDAAHDVPQIDHHVPGGAFVLEPVEDGFAVLEVREPRVFPTRQDVRGQPHPVFLAGRCREFDLDILDIIFAPQFGQPAEDDRAHLDRLLCGHRGFASIRSRILFQKELVALHFGRLLGEGAFAPARSDGVEFSADLIFPLGSSSSSL
jgi:hypothetical protein